MAQKQCAQLRGGAVFPPRRKARGLELLTSRQFFAGCFLLVRNVVK